MSTATTPTTTPTNRPRWDCPLCGREVDQKSGPGRPPMYHKECRWPAYWLDKFLTGLEPIEFTPEAMAWLKSRVLSYLNEKGNKAGRPKKLD